MDIKASKKWIQEYLAEDFEPKTFSKEVTAKAFPVDYTRELAPSFENMVVGLVKEVKAHPNADKLKIAVVDIGAQHATPVQIVCGGSNLVQGMRVFVALPGAKVRWHGEGDLVELKEVEIRGVASFGMICAPSEVGFEKASCPEKGIWDLTEWTSAAPGTSVVEALGLDDTIFEVEITTNRVDAMGIIGVAREAGAAMGIDFTFDPPALPDFDTEAGRVLPLCVDVQDPDACPRYMAVVIDGVKVGPSPAWLQTRLLLAGHRPINNIVDITNYVLREYGQPMHAFDYEKLGGHKIVVRRAKKGEEIKALDDETYELDPADLVIADGDKPVAVAGVMGGFDTGTWEGTTTIVFEAATFDGLSVRKTARRHHLYSDSQLLFEKGLSSEAPSAALARAIELTLEIAGGHVASAIFDERSGAYEPLVFPFRPQKARDLIGVDLSDDEMVDLLTRIGFEVVEDGDDYKVTVPFWRDHDIEHEVDLTEEVARLYGYGNLPSELPNMPPPTTPEDPALAWEMNTKKLLVGFGYTELYGYSMIGVEDMLKYGLDPVQAVQIHNPLSADLTHMRPSLMPSLLKDIEANQGERPAGQVFELQRTYQPRENDLPDERTEMTIAHYGVEDVERAFLELKGAVESWADFAGLELEIVRPPEGQEVPISWHATRTALIQHGDDFVGVIGQLDPPLQEIFGINRPVVVAQIDFESLVDQMKIVRRYEPIPEFPAVERDIAVVVDETVAYGDIATAVASADELVRKVDLVEVYRGAGIQDGKKSVTLSLRLRSDEKTLDGEQTDAVMQRVLDVLRERFSGIIR